MKKKICTSLMAFFLMFVMTGCVKFNASMDIKKDKSMDFKIIYAFDTTYFGDEELLEEADKVKLEEEGFTVTNYSDGSMKGFTMSKNIKNIDDVSSSNDTEYSLSSLVESSDNGEYLFKVKKGLLKNTYVAKLNFDSSDSSLNDSTDVEEEYDEEIDLDVEDEYDTDIDVDTEDDLDMDFDISLDDEELEEGVDSDSDDTDFDLGSMSTAMDSMDLSFNVTLPYAAISNNATTVSDDGKTLKWELTTDGASSIEFEFELYNMTNIYIGAGLLIALVVIIIGVVISKGKGKKTLDNGYVGGQDIQNNMEQNIGRDVYQASLQSVESTAQTVPTVGMVNTVQDTVNVEQPVEPVQTEPVAPVMDIPVVEQPVSSANIMPEMEVTVQPVEPVVPVVNVSVQEQPSVEVETPVQNPVHVEQPIETVQVEPAAPVMDMPVVEQTSTISFEAPVQNPVNEVVQPVVTQEVEPSQVILNNKTETLDVNSDNQNMN